MLLVLLGPKGAGKSHAGTVIERELGVDFFRVEPVFVAAAREPGGSGPASWAEGFRRVEEEIDRRFALGARAVAIESTGASDLFPPFLARQRAARDVRILRIEAPLEVCLERVRSRDARDHLPASDDLVREVHARSAALELEVHAMLDNAERASDAAIVAAARKAMA
jgi:shikimate kinase